MTMPREIIPRRTYLITRRCTQRQFFLRPDEKTNAIFAYCLAEAAERYGIMLVAWVAMSNHYHTVVHDPFGRLPAFLEHFHKMLAKALNVRWGRWENLWSSEETGVTYLPTAHDVFEKVVYVLANPLAEHLVDRIGDWPGCISLHYLGGRRTSHERPKSYFRATGSRMPARVELCATRPPPIAVTGGEASDKWAARVSTAVAERERALRLERQRTGARVLGRKDILRTSAFASPKTVAPRRRLRPAIAGKDGARRIAELAKLTEFRRAHERARRKYVAGQRNTEFPPGTYRMRVWGARCEPFPVAA
jgi:putative transposase